MWGWAACLPALLLVGLPACLPRTAHVCVGVRVCPWLGACRSGRLYVQRAIELGVEPGINFTRLKAGESVTTPEGVEVHPWQCVGKVRRGRWVCRTRPLSQSQPASQS